MHQTGALNSEWRKRERERERKRERDRERQSQRERERERKPHRHVTRALSKGHIKFVGAIEECLTCDRDMQWMGR